MKIERATLIALRAAAIADDSTTIVRSSVLLALLDVAEAVQDAPVARIHDGYTVSADPEFGSADETAMRAMHGQRVRLVRDGGE